MLNQRRTKTLVGWLFVWLVGSVWIAGCGMPPAELLTNLEGKALVINETVLFKPSVGQVYVYHTHGASVELTEIQVKGDKAVHFELVQAPAFPMTMEGGNQKGTWFNIQFFSSTVGSFDANLEIKYKVGENGVVGTLSIPMKATAIASTNPTQLLLDPQTTVLDFGTIHNQEAGSMELMLYNTSETILNITGMKLVDNEKKAFSIPFPLPTPFRIFPGKENGRPVVFQAQSATPGTYEAWLSLSSDNAGNLSKEGTRLIKLTVKVVKYKSPPRLRFRSSRTSSSSYVRFRDIPANQEHVEKLTLWNQGELPGKIVKMEFVNDEKKVWSFRNKPTLPINVEGPDLSKGTTFEVVYKNSISVPYSVMLQVDYLTDPEQPEAVTSVVFRLEHETSRAWYSFDCATLNFGRVPKDSSTNRSCRIRNTGNIDVVLKGVKYVKSEGADGHFKWLNPTSFPFTIRPGRSFTVVIEYKPKTKGAEDSGRFVPDTNIVVENEDDRPVLRVTGESNP